MSNKSYKQTTLFEVQDNDDYITEDNNWLDLIPQRSIEFNQIIDECLSSACIESGKRYAPKNCVECANEECDFKKIILDTKNFMRRYKRIPYSTITNRVKNLNDEEYENLSSVVRSIISYLRNKTIYGETPETLNENEIETFIKISDHIDLAYTQLTEIANSTIELRNSLQHQVEVASGAYKGFEKSAKSLETEIKNLKKDMYEQLISIVGIFVAISFVLFGGMSLLNNLFDYSNMASVPLLEMICGGSLIGLIIINAVYIFIVFILKITGRVINETDLVYKPYVKWFSIFLGVVVLITLALWFGNIRNVNDIKYINTNCKTVEYNEGTKEVTLVCPASVEKNKE